MYNTTTVKVMNEINTLLCNKFIVYTFLNIYLDQTYFPSCHLFILQLLYVATGTFLHPILIIINMYNDDCVYGDGFRI